MAENKTTIKVIHAPNPFSWDRNENPHRICLFHAWENCGEPAQQPCRHTEGWTRLLLESREWESSKERVQPSVLKEGAQWAGWAAGGPAKQPQASGSMAASLEIYSIKVGSLPGGFHQLHDLSRQLDLVQKPPLQIAIRGADWARDVCCWWHLSSPVSYTFPLRCSLQQKV